VLSSQTNTKNVFEVQAGRVVTETGKLLSEIVSIQKREQYAPFRELRVGIPPEMIETTIIGLQRYLEAENAKQLDVFFAA